MGERKIVQIAAMCHAGTEWRAPEFVTVALCNDGTAWERMNNESWTQLPPIPQAVSNEHEHAGYVLARGEVGAA